MTAAWYHLRLVALRQAVVAPVLVYLGLVAAVYASDAGPPVAAATVTAAALMPVTAWLYRLVATAESPPFADITLVRLHGAARRQLVWTNSTVLLAAALAGAGMLWAGVANPYPYPARIVAVIAILHMVQAFAGVGLGCLVSRPLPVRAGAAVLVVTAVVIASLILRWLPPLGPMLSAFYGNQTRSAQVASLAEAAGFAVALVGTGWALARRTT